MTVVTFEDFTPLPRYDGKPWATVKIQEAASADGPWTDLETKTLAPLDTNPENPMTRDFTTELATLTAGWYRLIFIDQTGDQQLPTEPIHNVPDVTAPYLPTVEDVAKQIMSRTKDRNGNEIGTFSDTTRPKYSDVLDLINQAADELTTILDTDVPEGAYEFAKLAITKLAAAFVERSYYAEQINTNRSPYPQLIENWNQLVGTPAEPGWLVKAIEREAEEAISGELPPVGGPSYNFPPTEWRYEVGRPL